jgi:hypothetical protein
MRWALNVVACALLAFPTAAAAEICDKAVGEAWRSEQGAVWLLNPVGFPYALTGLVAGLIPLLIVKAPWLQWLGFAVSAVLVVIAVIVVTGDLIPQHDIYLAQVREGCRSNRTDLMNVGLMLAIGVSYAWMGYRLRRRAASGLLAGN